MWAFQHERVHDEPYLISSLRDRLHTKALSERKMLLTADFYGCTFINYVYKCAG